MISASRQRVAPSNPRVKSAGQWLFGAARAVVLVVLVAWATLAIFYSMPWPWLRVALAVAFLAFSVWALWLTKRPHMSWAFVALFVVVAVGWSFIRPSHDRPWLSLIHISEPTRRTPISYAVF